MSECPICNTGDRRCKQSKELLTCRNSFGLEKVIGYEPVKEVSPGQGWVWKPTNEKILENQSQTLEAEFEVIKTKYQQALERVERLTREWENALPEHKKDAALKLKNAKDILNSLNSTRYVTSTEISRLTKRPKGDAETGFAKDFLVINEQVAEHLSYNLLTHNIHFMGKEVKFNSALLWLVETTGYLNWNKGDTSLTLLILDLAKKK